MFSFSFKPHAFDVNHSYLIPPDEKSIFILVHQKNPIAFKSTDYDLYTLIAAAGLQGGRGAASTDRALYV